MNTVHTSPELQAFVADVRGHLADLTEEEREELAGGLEADLADQVAERGPAVLHDPDGYATELRAAAGFGPEVSAPPARRSARNATMAWLDRGGVTWNRWADTGDHLGLPELLSTLRPVWWVLRALSATAIVTEVYGSQSVFGFTTDRALVALAAIVVSVQLGRGVWWPGNMLHRSLLLRSLVIGLNLLAALLLPVMFLRFMAPHSFEADYGSMAAYADESGEQLTFRGDPVGNVYAYDAAGNPLTGVQLVDQDGARLTLSADAYDASTDTQKALGAWMNGRTPLYSVFPLPESTTDPSTGEPTGAPLLQAPPYASLPPVSLDGVEPSVLVRSAPSKRAD